jgi:hypothetical protein
MAYSLGNNKTLIRRKIDCASFEVDQKMAIHDIKEFIEVFVLVPVIFTFDHTQAHNCIIYLAERLVVPFIGTGLGQLLDINNFERRMKNVEVSFVGKILSGFLGFHGLSLNATASSWQKKILKL